MTPEETFIAAALRPLAVVGFAVLSWLFVRLMARWFPQRHVRAWFQRIVDRATDRIAAGHRRQ